MCVCGWWGGLLGVSQVSALCFLILKTLGLCVTVSVLFLCSLFLGDCIFHSLCRSRGERGERGGSNKESGVSRGSSTINMHCHGTCTSFLGTISALILLQMLAILQTLQPEKSRQSEHLISLSTLTNQKPNKTTQMVLEKPANHIKHVKGPFAHLSAWVTTFACSGCLICIQHVVFAS